VLNCCSKKAKWVLKFGVKNASSTRDAIERDMGLMKKGIAGPFNSKRSIGLVTSKTWIQN
jgi:hypothetical protein